VGGPLHRGHSTSLSSALFAEPQALGRVTALINTASARPDSGAPTRDSGFARVILAFMRCAAWVYLSGKARA